MKNQTTPELIRLATAKESVSPIAKRRAFKTFAERKGLETVFMPYGPDGRGFYYVGTK